jgi:hypothetical protein
MNSERDERPLEEIAAEYGLSIIHPPIGTSMLKRIIDSLANQLETRKRRKKMHVDSLGITVLAWDNGSLRSCAIRRDRDNKGRFKPFDTTLQYPATIIDSKENIFLKQDEQAKLYVVRT